MLAFLVSIVYDEITKGSESGTRKGEPPHEKHVQRSAPACAGLSEISGGSPRPRRKHRRYLAQRRGLTLAEIDGQGASILEAVTADELDGYVSFSADGSPLSASSRCRRVSSVKSFFKYLTAKRRLLDRNPADGLDSPKKQAALPAYLSEREALRLIDAASGAYRVRDRAILTLFLSCGLRVSELVSLNLSDLGADRVRVLGKGGKERVVFFSEGCADALRNYLEVRDASNVPAEDADALFLSRDNRRISVRGVQKMVDKAIESAGLDSNRLSTHKLRHTAATLMLRNGVDTRVLQEILGHSSLNTTQIYTHVESDSLRAAAMANPIGARARAW